MVVLAQLVRASVCGTEGRGFEPHIPPQVLKSSSEKSCFFCLKCFIDCHMGKLNQNADHIIFLEDLR